MWRCRPRWFDFAAGRGRRSRRAALIPLIRTQCFHRLLPLLKSWQDNCQRKGAMKIAGLLVVLLTIMLVAGGTLCPPDTDNCVGGLLHAFVVLGASVALSAALVPEAYLEPARLVLYHGFCPDPAAPPPRG